MKKNILVLLIILIGYTIFSNSKASGTTIQVKGIKDTIGLLAYYYETNRFVQDTLHFDDKGVVTLKNLKTYPNGVYILAFPSLAYKYFDLILNKESNFSMSTDTLDLVMNMTINNSRENKALYENLKYSNSIGIATDSLQKIIKTISDTSQKYKTISAEINKKNQLSFEQREKIIQDYSSTFYASLLKMMQTPKSIVPDKFYNEKKEWKDTVATVNYIKNNYFDLIDFNDSAYVRSPIFKQYINQYFDNYIFPLPDSIIPPLDSLIAKAANGSPLMYKYIFNTLYDKYSKSQIMGFDRIVVHLADKYISIGKTPWIEPEQIKKIKDYIEDIRPTLIGSLAANFTFKDSNYVNIDFHSLLKNAAYTVLVFWNSDCGHCQKEIPIIKEKYDSLKALGVQVVSISTEQIDSTFRTFAAKNCSQEWITGWDPNGTSAFRREYFINSTPKVFVIDKKEQKIRAKNLPVEDLYGYIEFLKDRAKREE